MYKYEPFPLSPSGIPNCSVLMDMLLLFPSPCSWEGNFSDSFSDDFLVEGLTFSVVPTKLEISKYS